MAGIREVLGSGTSVCCNGAVLLDLAELAVLEEFPVEPPVLERVTAGLRASEPSTWFAVEYGDQFRHEPVYRPRWEAMATAVRREFTGAQLFVPDGGFFVSMMLPEDAHTDNLVGRAKDQDLVLTPGAAFFPDAMSGEEVSGDRFVRLPFCAVPPEQIDEGVRRLASLV